MPDEPPQTPDDTGNVLVFRTPTGDPVSVPSEVVEAAQVVYRAYLDKIAGLSWELVAYNHHYPNAGAAKADVERYIAEGASLVSDHSRQALLELEVSRLDALQVALWNSAMDGSVPAVSEVRQIIKTRADLVRTADEKIADGTRTVVIPMSQGDYTSTLRQIVEDSEAASGSLLPGSDDDAG